MALYSNPTFTIAYNFLSMNDNKFHYDVAIDLVDYLNAGVPPANHQQGIWIGHPINSAKEVYIKHATITKMNYWAFIQGAAILPIDNLPSVPLIGVETLMLWGIGNQNVSDITVPAPMVLTDFYGSNRLTYRHHIQKDRDVKHDYLAQHRYEIKADKTYINTALYTTGWAFPQPDLTNYIAQVVAAFNAYFIAAPTLYCWYSRYNLHIVGEYR